MAVRYSTEFIDELLKHVDMMEIMEKYGVAVKAGSGKNHFYKATFCCGKLDFDNGRIVKEQQTYKCRACQTGGNALHFLMSVGNKKFPDAVVELANMYGVNLPVVDPEEEARRRRKEKAFRLAMEFYRDQENYEYLLGRGISLDVLKKHQVGYAPGGRALRSYLEQQGYTKSDLLEYRLINSRGLDSLFYRAIIPIMRFGQVIDFYGRAVQDDKAGVKHFFLNGQDILGGIDLVDPKRTVYLFEAAIDRLAAESHGLTNGIDTGGAGKFTKNHARQLHKKGIRKIVIIYDGDEAGRKGALDTGTLLEEQGINVWVGELPDKTDTAKMLQEQGRDAFKATLDFPKTFQQYKMYKELEKYPLSEIEAYLNAMKTGVN